MVANIDVSVSHCHKTDSKTDEGMGISVVVVVVNVVPDLLAVVIDIVDVTNAVVLVDNSALTVGPSA